MCRFRALAATTVLVVALSGCGDDTVNTSSTETTTPSTSPTSQTTGTATATAVTSTSVPEIGPTNYLTSVVANVQTGHDCIVFTFENGVPGYIVEYVDAKDVVNTAGSTVPVAGGNSLRIVLAQASGVRLDGGYRPTYTGDKRFTPTGTSIVTELAQVEDFESRLQWVAGVKEKRPFAVEPNPNNNTLTVRFEW